MSDRDDTPVVTERERKRRISDSIEAVMNDHACSLKQRTECAVRMALEERDREWVRALRLLDIDPASLPVLRKELKL